MLGKPGKSLGKLVSVLLIAALATVAAADPIITIKVRPCITTVTLPNGMAKAPYYQALTAEAGQLPYSWWISSGSLPPDLTLDSSGVISGTPRAAGTSNVVIAVSDAQEEPGTAYMAYSLAIDPNPDTQGPAISSMGTTLATIRKGVDLSVSIVALASDIARGGSDVVAAEYYLDADPGYGHGTAMAAADGALDSPLEVITGTIDTSAWTAEHRIFIRAQDQVGNWSGANSFVIHVTDDVTPPGAVTDLDATAMGTFARITASSHEFSSAGTGTPVTMLFDNKSSTWWQTAGTTTRQTESVTIDAGAVRSVGAILLIPAQSWTLFPSEFAIETSADGTAWTKVAGLKPPRRQNFGYLWEWEAVDARYVRVSGPGVYNAADRRFYWRIADASLYSTGGPIAQLTFTAPANDGYAGARATSYDVRFSPSPITEANFASCPRALGLGSPRTPGSIEKSIVRIESTDISVHIAVKSVDDVGNWSAISNVVRLDTKVSGFVSREPGDATTVSATAPPTFTFRMDPTAGATFIAFGSSIEFVTAPTVRADGQTDKSVRFAVKPGLASWIPTAAQWKSVKAIAPTDGCVYWRLEGALGKTISVYGPAWTILFDSGHITDLAVSPSHANGADEAIWPDRTIPPFFSWTNATAGMTYFFVDVSTLESVPPSDRARTIVLGKGVTGNSYTATKAEWKRIRQLATQGGGTLYWRVRAKDAEKALTSASAVKKLVIDGGTWSVGDLNLSSTPPAVAWSHTGNGVTMYALEVSAAATFPATARMTVRVPSMATAATSHTFTAGEVTRLKALARANGVTTLYYRVRGEDGERAFITRSDAKSAIVPGT